MVILTSLYNQVLHEEKSTLCLSALEDLMPIIKKDPLVQDKQWNVSTFLLGKLFKEKSQ